ncbi:reverse transcriptase-like protein [Viridibacterium curvum]|uniref:RNase H type-1 domain-containing protein n=1 Tax=Viridibacterium curvum TaxID=1101404 RepID=A0ABP9QJ66_9RHOO
MEDVWQIFCDGSALPNPGRMAAGVLILAPDGRETRISQLLPGHGSNNEAELRALLLALQTALSLGADCIALHSDSRVVIDELSGTAARPYPGLPTVFALVNETLARFDSATLRWVPAHRNLIADNLARSALGLPARPA